eukprot:7241659-Lingulodinium_polyedra.AAC.1
MCSLVFQYAVASGPPELYCAATDGTVWCRACNAAISKAHIRGQGHMKKLQWMADEAASAGN